MRKQIVELVFSFSFPYLCTNNVRISLACVSLYCLFHWSREHIMDRELKKLTNKLLDAMGKNPTDLL